MASRDELCLRCAFPLHTDRSVLAVLSRVRDMMAHAGYAVDRLVIDQSRPEPAPLSVSLSLRRAPSSPKRRLSGANSAAPPSKRTSSAPCRQCASSCCSTNSLCKAHACDHRNEDVSRPLPPSPNDLQDKHAVPSISPSVSHPPLPSNRPSASDPIVAPAVRSASNPAVDPANPIHANPDVHRQHHRHHHHGRRRHTRLPDQHNQPPAQPSSVFTLAHLHPSPVVDTPSAHHRSQQQSHQQQHRQQQPRQQPQPQPQQLQQPQQSHPQQHQPQHPQQPPSSHVLQTASFLHQRPLAPRPSHLTDPEDNNSAAVVAAAAAAAATAAAGLPVGNSLPTASGVGNHAAGDAPIASAAAHPPVSASARTHEQHGHEHSQVHAYAQAHAHAHAPNGASPRADSDRDGHAGWTATTGAPGTSFDASRERMMTIADLPLGSSPIQTTGNAHRGSQLCRMTSSEARADVRRLPSNHNHHGNRIHAAAPSAPKKMEGKNERKAVESGLVRRAPDLTCPSCLAKFTTELELRKHQFTHHRDDKTVSKTTEGRFLCLMHSCAQSFVRRHVMERHFKTVHMLVKNFPCPFCDRAFADSSTRDAHRRAVHEKLKPWKCERCHSSFTQSSSLGKHRRRFHQGSAQTSPQKP